MKKEEKRKGNNDDEDDDDGGKIFFVFSFSGRRIQSHARDEKEASRKERKIGRQTIRR
jgi:hypothetical protein